LPSIWTYRVEINGHPGKNYKKTLQKEEQEKEEEDEFAWICII
jgi:hypothetical protein